MMIDRMYPVWISKKAARCIGNQRIVLPTIPECSADIHKLLRPLVAKCLLHVALLTEVIGRVVVGCSDDIPAGAAITDMVQRGEAFGNVVRLIISRGQSRDKAEALGHGGDCG